MSRAHLAKLGSVAVAALAAVAGSPLAGTAHAQGRDIDQIENVVVIFAENRSFDNLYGRFPGADGIDQASPESLAQKDRDGTPLTELPPIWDGLTAKGVTPPVTQAETEHLANGVFFVDDPKGFDLPLSTITHDLWHRYYQNMMQIDGGKNDMFVAWADSGAMTMGMWDGSPTEMWKVAQKYTLADHWFMGGFGGSFFNHQWLICACAPHYDNADTSAAKPTIAKVDPDGVTLTLAENSPKSALEGIPKFVSDGNLTPDFYAVNTMQPPYQPSANAPADGGDPRYADPLKPTTLPPQTEPTIGDVLSLKGVTWAWYGGAWQYVLDNGNNTPVPTFQYHHQPFNYYASFAPGTPARAEHLRDGGLGGANFLQVIDSGKLPRSRSTSRRATSTSTRAMPTSSPATRTSPTWSAISRRARSGSTCWSSSPMTRTAASGTTWLRRRATAGARARGSRRSSSRPLPSAATSITRPTTRRRSCASSPSGSSCPSCAASWCATALSRLPASRRSAT